MTDVPQSASAVRQGRRPFVRMAGVLALLAALGSPAASQPVTWERLPLVPTLSGQRVPALDFLRGEGAQADDPAADSLVVFHEYSLFLYNPSGAAGAAGDNGEWGPWHRLCSGGFCYGDDGLVTAAGSVLMGSPSGPSQLSRGTDRGRTWAFNSGGYSAYPFFESSLPGLVGPDGAPALLVGIGDGGETARSLEDGAPGSWVQAGTGLGYPEAFGEVPPSPALPDGRVLLGTWSGPRYSDDGGLTYALAEVPPPGSYIVYAFAFVPQAGHPYGGVAYAGAQNTALPAWVGAAEIHRSDDGGATWALAHRFTAAELELPVFTGGDNDVDVQDVTALVATSDGALWAGVGFSGGASNPARGGIARSLDGGATWTRADGGFRDASGRGYQVNQFRVSRTGMLYAATERGVWRTTAPVVAGEPGPPGASSERVALSVRPNPAGTSAAVTLALAEPGDVSVVVFDVLGRAVQTALHGALAAGTHRAAVDVGSLAPGVYVVRATAGGSTASARLVVAR